MLTRECRGTYPDRFLDFPIDCKTSNFEYIPFVAGRRIYICPGMVYLLSNIELHLTSCTIVIIGNYSDSFKPLINQFQH